MNLEYVPLLGRISELYAIPRGPARFAHYLKLLKGKDEEDVRYPPLVALNPMAKEPVAALVDQLLALDADGLAAAVCAQAAVALAALPGSFKAALTVVDDAGGGWSNRWLVELGTRLSVDPHAKRFWVFGVLWSSEPTAAQTARSAMAAAIYRAAWALRHGPAHTLGAVLAQESYAMAAAGVSGPTLDADDLDYTAAVLEPLLAADDRATLVACLFGDEAARSLGYRPHGLSPWAGLALARQRRLHPAAAAAPPG